MANPIQPVGGNDIVESARQQDAERRRREAQDHFDRTGERLPEYQEYDPLVPINGHSEPPDVADDGDAYDETRRPYRSRALEMAQDPNSEACARALDSIFGQGYSEHMTQQRQLREQAIKAERDKEIKAEEERKAKLNALKEESKKKFNNAVSGLEVDEDEE